MPAAARTTFCLLNSTLSPSAGALFYACLCVIFAPSGYSAVTFFNRSGGASQAKFAASFGLPPPL